LKGLDDLPELMEHFIERLGLVYCKAGDLVNGKTELELALKSMPTDAETRQTLELIKQAVSGIDREAKE
jgi:hypothetical protein